MKSSAAVLFLHLISLLAFLTLSCRGDAPKQTQYGAVDTTVVTATCDPRGMIPQGSPFWGHLGFLLQQLAENAPYTPSLSFKTRVGGSDTPAFGEAACDASCAPEECYDCLLQLSSDIWRICNSALGAKVAYPSCWIHYECFYF